MVFSRDDETEYYEVKEIKQGLAHDRFLESYVIDPSQFIGH